MYQPTELTVAANRMAGGDAEELGRLGVAVTLEESGRARLPGRGNSVTRGEAHDRAPERSDRSVSDRAGDRHA